MGEPHNHNVDNIVKEKTKENIFFSSFGANTLSRQNGTRGNNFEFDHDPLMAGRAKACLADVFDACQHAVTAHNHGIQRCLGLQAQDVEGFRREFIEHVERVLVVWKREPSVERVCKFIVSFVTRPDQQRSDNGSPLFNSLIRHLLDVSDAKDKAVRFRATDLIARMMHELDEEAEIEYFSSCASRVLLSISERGHPHYSEDLWELLLGRMLKRGQDKFPTIRTAAVHALSRLQDVGEEEDPVTAQYLRLLATDSCKCVLPAISPTKY